MGRGKTREFLSDLQLLKERLYSDDVATKHVDSLLHLFIAAIHENPVLDGKPRRSLVADHLYSGVPEPFLRFLLDANALIWVGENYSPGSYTELRREFADERSTVEFTIIDEDETAIRALDAAIGRAIVSTSVLIDSGHIVLPSKWSNVAGLMNELRKAYASKTHLMVAVAVAEEPPKKAKRSSKVVEDDDDE